MNDDYLWDGSGPPDPEIERLERALAPLRPSRPLAAEAPVARPRRRGKQLAVLAAAVVCGLAALVLLRVRPAPVPTPVVQAPAPAIAVPGWELSVPAGGPPPTVDGVPVTGPAQLSPGQILSTAAGGQARLAVPGIGAVDVAPNTRLGLVETGRGPHRVRLVVGTIHAFIYAPPGTFFVETPAGTAVDLGCAYSVTVDEAGDGLLKVHTGWVGFEQFDRESFIPAGAECPLRRSAGPGTPLRSDAPPLFRAALTAFDNPIGFEERKKALRQILKAARAQDAVSLWHLLVRAPAAERRSVLRRMTALVPQARFADENAVVAGEQQALDDLWNRLDLGPMALWRQWKAAPAPLPAR